MAELRDELNSIMESDHVIHVTAPGVIDRMPTGVYAPEIVCMVDDDGQILAEHERDMVEYAERQGWSVETGWSRQHGYSGPIMHESEYIGGNLADHILETPGYWVACPVDVDSEECPNESPTCKLSDPCVICYDGTGPDRERVSAGWLLLHSETGHAPDCLLCAAGEPSAHNYERPVS